MPMKPTPTMPMRTMTVVLEVAGRAILFGGRDATTGRCVTALSQEQTVHSGAGAGGREMRFAKWVFLLAGITGILVVIPLYFLEERFGRDQPPPVNHPEFYYGFVGV